MRKEINMIFLDKAILYLTQNIEKEREIIEEELEFVIKQSILNYLVKEKNLILMDYRI